MSFLVRLFLSHYFSLSFGEVRKIKITGRSSNCLSALVEMASIIEADAVFTHAQNLGLNVVYTGLTKLDISVKDDAIDYTLNDD